MTEKKELITLYENESSKMYNFIYKMTGNKTASEDILQETFITAFNKIGTFRGDSSLSTWIYSIARNYCLQHLRKMKKTRFTNMEKLINFASESEDNSLYEGLEKNIYLKQIKEGCLLGLLRCLPLSQRLAFILNVLNEIPLEDTAQIIEKSINATRILVHRSRSKIKKFLCENCSLYKKGNYCKCENLISFSLKNGWISDKSEIEASQIESELHDFTDEIALYKSLYEYKVKEKVFKKILDYTRKSDSKIFFKKVK